MTTSGDADGVETAVHLVQFYEDDAFLVDAVDRFIGTGLGLGDVTVVIATPRHRDDLEERFRARNFDLAAARKDGRYLALDAAETLAKIMVDGLPDEARFHDTIGSAIARLANGRAVRVRAFAEMVALLCADGNGDAAIHLERLWNALARTLPLSLLCAYPMQAFGRNLDGAFFLKVCEEHAEVVPAESFTALTSPTDRLRAITHLQQQALALAGESRARETAEEALQHHQREMADFFENASMALHWAGPDGIIRRANRAELELLGYAPAEYVGHHVAEFHADQAVIADILQRLGRGETLHDSEARLRCKDGTIKDVLIDANVLWMGGKFVHTRCFTRDVTAARRAAAEREESLRMAERARAEAETASRAKDEFLSVVSHELRTPLASMLGWVSVLKAGATGPRAARALETIERSGRVQAKLIEDLLDVSRIITGQMRLDLRPIDLPAAMRLAVDTIRPTAEAKGVRIDARLDPSAGPVAGDAERLQQIAWNLLSNAVKFTPAGGLVEVRLERRDPDFRFVVRDTGRGIARDFLPCVFERFRQADSAASRRTGGLGLGLAIVRHLVDLHGGTVAVASEGEGQGATFTITFPVMPLQTAGDHDGGPGRALASQDAG